MQLDWSNIVAWAAVVATLIGAFYVRSQAVSIKNSLRLTREAKDAAIDQANSARESAQAAWVSKEAAVDQARSARESVEIARRALDQADKPQFSIEATAPAPRRTSVPVTILMTGGPPAINVDLSWISEATTLVSQQVNDVTMGAGTGEGTYELVLNDKIELLVDVPEQARAGEIKIILECRELGADERTWVHVEIVRWKRWSPPRVW